MKTINSKGLKFGFSAVVAGQRNASAEPQVVAVSTLGGFRITGPVSKALGIGAGDYVQFVNNIPAIDEAIKNNDESLVAFCEENGLTLGTPEAAIAIHKEFDFWGICKGVAALDKMGNARTTTERLTIKDKIKYVTVNFDELYAAAVAEDSGISDEVREALIREGVTRDEQVTVLTQFVQAKELPKYLGSKTANAAGMTGIGLTLNFTDANVWKQLKSDLGELAEKKNRIFAVNLEEMTVAPIDNGYETVEVSVLPLLSYVDEDPIDRAAKKDAEDAE